MQTGKHTGKIVVRVQEDDQVTAMPHLPPTRIFSEATYVLAGGLGGICREFGRWLAENGAKNLVFLSRHAATKLDNIDYVQTLKESHGVNAVAFNCDVGNRTDLQLVLETIKSSMPPIRGCITGAMVLEVC